MRISLRLLHGGALQAFEPEEAFGYHVGSGFRVVGAHYAMRADALAVSNSAG